MVAYRLDGIPSTLPLTATRPRPEVPVGVTSWLAESRRSAESYQHPVAVFDAGGHPVFQNRALSTQLTPEAVINGRDSWPLAYSTACRFVAEAIAGHNAISTVIPVNQRSFAILGSLLRQESGIVLGAIVHISEVNAPTASRPDTITGRFGSDTSSSDDSAYQTWVLRHNEAQSKMQRLSPRESQVVSRVSVGMPNKSIARELEISVKTIEKHRANAVRKLGVTSTPEMVRIAVLAEDEPIVTQTIAVESVHHGPMR